MSWFVPQFGNNCSRGWRGAVVAMEDLDRSCCTHTPKYEPGRLTFRRHSAIHSHARVLSCTCVVLYCLQSYWIYVLINNVDLEYVQ
jgi:hypothetical protein